MHGCAADLILDYGNNNLQTVNGVRPAISGENAYGAIINNEILNHNNYISLNGYLKFEFLKKLSFNSQFAYENATADNFRFDNNQFGAAATVDGRVSQSRNFFKTLNAIQRTTASGVCAVVQAYAEGKLTGSGFQKQEDVPFEVFTSNKFGKLYEQD